MQGKKSESSEWVKQYLSEQGVDISDWTVYGPLYNRYRARIRKYSPENYEQFLATCTFQKQRKQHYGPEDLGDYKKELGGWGKPKLPKEPKEPKPIVPKEPPFNEEKYWKDQKKEWQNYKVRMLRYREDKIRNQKQQGETGREKDLMPYTFKFALKCLVGTFPEEIFPKELEEFREELQGILEKQRKELKWTTAQ